MIYQLSTLWLLLTAAAAREQYNEVPDVGNEILSQDSEVDAVAVEPRAEEARLQDLLLFQLIRARLREDLEARRRLHKEQAEFEDMENSVMKRVAPERNVRPQRWWKTKKGRGVANHRRVAIAIFTLPYFSDGAIPLQRSCGPSTLPLRLSFWYANVLLQAMRFPEPSLSYQHSQPRT